MFDTYIIVVLIPDDISQSVNFCEEEGDGVSGNQGTIVSEMIIIITLASRSPHRKGKFYSGSSHWSSEISQ